MDANSEEVGADLEEGVQEEENEEEEAQAEEFKRAKIIKDIITQVNFEEVLTLFGEIRDLNSQIGYQEEIKKTITIIKENSKNQEEHKHGNMPNPELKSKLVDYFENEIKYYYKGIDKHKSNPEKKKYIPTWETKIAEFKEFLTEINSYFEPEESQIVKQRGTDVFPSVQLTHSIIDDEDEREDSADESNVEHSGYRINSVHSSVIKGGKSTVEDPKLREVTQFIEQKAKDLKEKSIKTSEKLKEKVELLLERCSQLEELKSRCNEVTQVFEKGGDNLTESDFTKLESHIQELNKEFKVILINYIERTMVAIENQQISSRKDSKEVQNKIREGQIRNKKLEQITTQMINKSKELHYQIDTKLKELEKRNSEVEDYITKVKNSTTTLGSELAQMHKEQVQNLKGLNQKLVKENKSLSEELHLSQKDSKTSQKEFEAKETQMKKYIGTLKQRCLVEEEWKEHYKSCLIIYSKEYTGMLNSFKITRSYFYDSKKKLSKCVDGFFESFPSKVKEAEDNVKEALITVQDYISTKEDERNKELKGHTSTFKDLVSRINSLNSKISKFNSKLVMSEEQHEEFKTRSTKHQIAQMWEVWLKPIEGQLQEQLTKASELRTELSKQDREISKTMVKEYTYKGCNVKLVKGEATQYQAGAIVCPTNENLGIFGGEAELIRNGAGEKLDQQCEDYIQQHGRLPAGKAALFKVGNLKQDYAILASVPYYAVEDKYHRRSKVNMHRLVKDILGKIVTKDIEKIVIPILVTKETNFPKVKYAKILAFVLRDFVDEYQKEMKNKEIILCAQKAETCETLITYLTEALDEKQREASLNTSSDEETKERQEAYLQEIERERRRVMGRKNKFERKSQKKASPRKDSPGLEDYHTPPESNENECKKCGKEINDRSHQTNGKHKYRCIECYYERKAKKRSDREEEKRSRRIENQDGEEDSRSD